MQKKPQNLNFKIEGGHKLKGEITTNTSKNGAMGLMCAALLNEGITTLRNIPKIEEVERIIEVLRSIEVSVEWLNNKDLKITPPKQINLEKINRKSATKTRTILMFMGPLIHLFKKFKLPHSQGCKFGKRTAAAHIFGLEELGAKVKVTHGNYEIKIGKLKAREVVMFEAGDTACENILMAAAKIPGKTVIKFAPANYMVQDVCLFLEKCGVKVEGIGTTTLTVHGVKKIKKNIEHYNSEDPIEAMMFITAGIATNSQITVKRCPFEFLDLELYKLHKMGFKYDLSKKYKSKNGYTTLVDVTTYPSKLTALDEKINCQPYPGLNIDNLPFFLIPGALAKGTTLIHDWVYENRAIYYMELTKLGVQMILADPHRVYIEGPNKFKPAEIVCPPALRPAVVILLAMLGAKGTSILRNVYSINRGYEDIAKRLNTLGAKIEIIE